MTIVDGLLSITIGIHTLAHAAANSEAPGVAIVVNDPDVFAQSVLARLQDEQEDGTTPVHLMLDTVFEAMADHGDDGLDLEYDEDDE